MFKAHSISENLLNIIQNELKQQNKWIAYNTASYYLKNGDVYFFNDKTEAHGFASDNISDQDSYRVIYANSIREVTEKLLYGRSLDKKSSTEDDVNGLKSLDRKDFSVAQKEYLEKQQSIYTQNKNIMNQKNYDYLKDQIKFTGFGEGLENELKEKMQKQSPQFLLSHESNFRKDETISTLHFKKSDQSDMYFFNKYDLTLKQENTPGAMTQTFYINKGSNITLKEAYNLMNGRAVNKDLTNKEGQAYNAWIQFDIKNSDQNGNYKIKQFHQNYGFDLEKSLGKLPIKELSNEADKSNLLNSLQKGNMQAVTFIDNGREGRRYIEANPQFKTINLYDNNMQRMGSRQTKDEKQGQGESNMVKQNTKKGQNQNNDDPSPDVPKQEARKGKKKSQAIS